jgi:cobalt/nickel transport system permease protein
MPLGHLSARIDRYAYTNNLSKVSPLTKIFFSVSVLLISVSVTSYLVPIITFLAASLLLIGYAKIPVHFYWKLLRYPLIMTVLSCFFIAFFFGYGQSFVDIILPWFRWTVFNNGISMAVLAFLRVMGGLSCLYFLVLTTPMTDILITSKKMHIPMILIEMSLLVYRYIFLFLDNATQMNIAQNLRLGNSNMKRRFRSLALLAGNLFIRTLEQGERTFTAMIARGYDGKIISLEDLPQMKLSSIIGIIFFDFLLLTISFVNVHLWSL